MKSLVLFFTCFLVLIFQQSHGQASWTFNVWFNLTDKNQNILSPEDYLDQNIELYTFENGAHANTRFIFEEKSNTFKFSQHTIASFSVMIFVSDKDTTVIELGGQDVFINAISLTGNNYKIQHWQSEDDFDCTRSLKGYPECKVCMNRYSFESYKSRKLAEFDLKEMKRIELRGV